MKLTITTNDCDKTIKVYNVDKVELERHGNKIIITPDKYIFFNVDQIWNIPGLIEDNED